MTRFWLSLLLCLLFSLKVLAQTGAVITGTVYNEAGEPLPGLTVTCTGTSDKTAYYGKTTNEGVFSVRVPKGVFVLSVTAINYNTYTKEPVLADNTRDSIKLGRIILQKKVVTELEAVVVKAEKPMIEQQLDRTVINVNSMIGASSGNAMQLLEKTPGIVVEGNSISINGRGSITVMIDGRPTYMSEADLSNYLKSMPAASIDKIELIPIPPSSYEANGSSMVNIILRKNKLKGVSGSISSGVNAGKYVRTNNTAILYYNNKKLQLVGNLSYNRDAGFSDYDYDRLFFEADGSPASTVRQNNYTKFSSNNVSGRLGVDYNLSANTSVGAIINLQQTPSAETMQYTTHTQDAAGNTAYKGYGFSNQEIRSTNYSVNIHGMHRFKKEGQTLSVDVNHILYDKNSQLQLNKLSQGQESIYNYAVPVTIQINNAQLDYAQPLRQQVNFEAGIKTARVITNNTFNLHELSGGGNGDKQANTFNYHEWVNAAYISINKKWKRLSGKLGLRGEQTNIRGTEPPVVDTHGDGAWFSRSYFSLFPSAFLSYSFDSAQKKNLVLSFSRRINRPGFQQLNPFLIKQDDYNYYGGNPQLLPQFNNHIDLKYQHKSFWGITAVYSGFKRIIFQSTRVQDSVFIRQPENIAQGVLLGLANNFNVAPVKWWRLNANIMLVRLYLNGETFGQHIRQEVYTGRLNLYNQFQIAAKWKAELSFTYNHRDLQGQTITRPRYRFNTAVQCELLSGKAQLRFFADDIFRTWVQRGITKNLEQSQVYFKSINETRMAGFSFSMRLGAKNNKTTTHRETTSDEKERMQ